MSTLSPYAQKIADFRQLLSEHNSECESEDRLDIDDIVNRLKKEQGGTTERALRYAKFEHLTAIGVPQILAEAACKEIFRKTDAADKPAKTKVLKADRVAALPFKDLFDLYDPTGETNALVKDRLEKEAKGRKCVVFDPNNNTKILAKESAQRLRELNDGYPEKNSITVGGKLAKVYLVGDNPNAYADENFLYPGEMLRNGVCDHTNRNVSNVPHEARQIVYLAITMTGEITIDDVEAAHRILDTLDCDSPVDKAQSRYQDAALKLQEQREVGDDPKLRIKKNGGSGSPSNNPFNTGQHVRT